MGLFATGYDEWKLATPPQYEDGEPARAGCSVCGRGDEPPCSPECERADYRRQAGRHFAAARLAIQLVKRYRDEGDGLESPRLLAALARFGELRERGRALLRASRGES